MAVFCKRNAIVAASTIYTDVYPSVQVFEASGATARLGLKVSATGLQGFMASTQFLLALLFLLQGRGGRGFEVYILASNLGLQGWDFQHWN